MNEIEFNKIFDMLVSKSGLSDSEIARRLGVNRSTIGRWKSGEQSPPLSKIPHIAHLFEVKPTELISGIKEELTNEEVLIQKYRALDDKGRHAVEVVAEIEFRRVMDGSHLTVIAAHNDDISEEQIDMMQQDLEELKRIAAKKKKN